MSDVPLAIAEFFVEEVRTELTGIQVEETYFTDDYNEESGEPTGTQTERTRMVNQYVDTVYVVLLDRGQSVSWEQVQNVTEKHAGKRDNVIDTFISLAMVQTLGNSLMNTLYGLEHVKL